MKENKIFENPNDLWTRPKHSKETVLYASFKNRNSTLISSQIKFKKSNVVTSVGQPLPRRLCKIRV